MTLGTPSWSKPVQLIQMNEVFITHFFYIRSPLSSVFSTTLKYINYVTDSAGVLFPLLIQSSFSYNAPHFFYFCRYCFHRTCSSLNNIFFRILDLLRTIIYHIIHSIFLWISKVEEVICAKRVQSFLPRKTWFNKVNQS